MDFKIGKKYICRNGEVVTIEHLGANIILVKEHSVSYWSSGKIYHFEDDELDLIEEYNEEEELFIQGNEINLNDLKETEPSKRGDGGSTSYYDLPDNATDLGHLIKHKKMEHGIGEAFCALYRLNDNGEYKRNLSKAKYYIDKELEWLEKQANQ